MATKTQKKPAAGSKKKAIAKNAIQPTAAQLKYLTRGLEQPGGKLPLFDEFGQEVDTRTVRACLKAGWAEPWFANPLKPDWLVCKLSAEGFKVLRELRH